jgi:hypothetical protein
MNPSPDELRGDKSPALGWRGSLRAWTMRLVRSRYGLLLLGLAFLLLLGVAFLTDFGPSVDEWQNAYYGRLFLDLYRSGSLFRSPEIGYFNGPFYFMIFNLSSRLFLSLEKAWSFTDGLHLTNYLTFLVGLFFFYRLALRLVPRGVGLLVTALFATQPVLFGHAFINQKDIPLMVFFLASVELGWTAIELRAEVRQEGTRGGSWRGLAGEWQGLRRGLRRVIVVAGVVGALLLLDLWWWKGMQGAARDLLGAIYEGRGPGMLVELFRVVAEDAYKTPLSGYVGKLDRLFGGLRWGLGLVVVGGMVIGWKLLLPESFAGMVERGYRRWGAVLVAGAVLGMTTSIRALGPFAGVLVGAYWLWRERRGSIGGLVAYGVTAVVTTYLTWPVLWGNPLVAVGQRLSEMPRFELHEVLFQGSLYPSGALPWDYLPGLLLVQLTLPCLVLLGLGVPSSWILTRGDGRRRAMTILAWAWFILPALTIIFDLVPAYQNFRHVLFALPPVFLMMGFGSWKAAEWVRSPGVRGGLAALALLPGVVGIVRLHPYEYVYYNELVGGIPGAQGRFELDYFCTASREAMDVVNRQAEPGSRVVFMPNFLAARMVAREDLLLQKASGKGEPDFAVACHRDALDPSSFYPNLETIDVVRLDGASLAVVKRRASTR